MDTKYRAYLKPSETDEDNDRRKVLIIERNGVVVDEHWDGGEPEDSTFSRDWYWVVGELEKAYAFGFADGSEK